MAARAAALGDRKGKYLLAWCLWTGEGVDCDQQRSLALFKEAAELGLVLAMHMYVQHCPGLCETEKYAWLGRAAKKGLARAANDLCKDAVTALADVTSNSSRAVFGIGAASAGAVSVGHCVVFGNEVDRTKALAVHRCTQFWAHWTDQAKRAVYCWIWAARQMGVPKDLRRLICGLLWRQKQCWIDDAVARARERAGAGEEWWTGKISLFDKVAHEGSLQSFTPDVRSFFAKQ